MDELGLFSSPASSKAPSSLCLSSFLPDIEQYNVAGNWYFSSIKTIEGAFFLESHTEADILELPKSIPNGSPISWTAS